MARGKRGIFDAVTISGRPYFVLWRCIIRKTPAYLHGSLVQLLINNGFRICGTNDRWFADQKNATAAFYGYDL